MTDFTVPAPIDKQYLPFQLIGIKWCATRFHSLLADEMGLGKTIQAIGVINRLKARRVLIICPASVKLNWQRELRDWVVQKLKIHVVMKRAETLPLAHIYIINYDLIAHSNIQRQLQQWDFDIGICDEAHYLKSMQAQRTKAVLGRKGILNKCKFKIMLTGTPVLNRPIELYPMLKVLSANTIKPYDDYRKFAFKFCNAWEKGFRLEVRGASNTEELNKRLRKDFMLRRLESEVAVELPPKRHQLILMEQGDDIKPIMKVMDKFERGSVKKEKMKISLTEIAELRQRLAIRKTKASFSHIKNILQEVPKLTIFHYHRSVNELLFKELAEFNPARVWGGQTATEKQQNINRFTKNQSCRVFIGQIQAAGQGIDGLQRVCNHMLFLEWSWVPGEITQAIKRVHRMGQTKPVLIQFIVWNKSIEEYIMRTALDKVKVIKELVN